MTKLRILLWLAMLWAGAAGAATVVPMVIMVRTNGIVDGPHGVVTTTGSTTAGIQEAYNALIQGVDYLHPAGGKIVLVDSAPYFTSTTILCSNNFCGDVDIEGPGLMAGGIVLRSPTPQPVIKITSKALGSGADAVCPMAVHIHRMFIGPTNNSPTNVIEINDFARAEVDHSWIGHWVAMTNNNAAGNAVGFSTCTFGYGVSNTALVGISFRGISDMIEIHGNSFLGCAASVYSASDHVRVWNNFSSYCGISNACANTSPFSMGAAFVCQAEHAHNDMLFRDNFFYNCQAGYLVFSTNQGSQYNYANIESRNDTYEATLTNVLISANMRMKQYDPAFLRASANNNSIVSTKPFTPQNFIDTGRVQTISTRTNGYDVSTGATFGNKQVGIVNSFSATNTVYVLSSGTAAANNTYTNPQPNSSATTWTNAGTHYYVQYDAGQEFNTLGVVSVYNNSGTELYGWNSSADDPLVWQASNIPPGGPQPPGEVLLFYSGYKTVITGNGAGLTNIAATSVAPTVVQTNFISGTVYSNFYGVPIQVSVNVVTTAAAVTGVAKMDLRISGAAGTGTTNTIAEQTGAAVITGSNTNVLMGIVPTSSTYTFTNTSSGAGNSSATSGGQLIVY